MSHSTITLIACAGLIGLAGCSAVPTEEERARGVVCPKCEIVWVDRWDLDDPYVMSTVKDRTMACPDCESAVTRFFKTGQLEHYCASCDGTLWYCTTEAELAAQRRKE